MRRSFSLSHRQEQQQQQSQSTPQHILLSPMSSTRNNNPDANVSLPTPEPSPTVAEKMTTSFSSNLELEKVAPIDEVDAVFLSDPAFERRLLRKLDLHLMPIISVMFMLSFLDRANIGNAFAAGMIKDLHLVGLQSNIASAVFFLTYSTFEVPANMCLKVLRPSRWIPSMMFAWGSVLTLMCLVKSYHGLIAGRLFLGVAETGMFPGALYYTSLWYPRKEMAFRVSIFFVTAQMGVAFGGVLAFAIEKMEGVGGLHGWAWLFCLEGLATIIMAVVAFFVIHDHPKTAPFLTTVERNYLITRLRQDQKETSTHFQWKFIKQAFTDPKIYLQMGVYLGYIVPNYSLSLFLPTIITQLGFGAANAQLLTVPGYVIAFPLALITSTISDKHMIRGPFLMFWTSFGIVGFAILLSTTSPAAGYAGAVCAIVGAVTPVPVSLAWMGNNMAGDLKRAVGFALVLTVCNYFGIVSSFTYRMSQAPRFHDGHIIVMAFMCFSVCCVAASMFIYHSINKRREARCVREKIDISRAKEFADLGDASPLFRYTL